MEGLRTPVNHPTANHGLNTKVPHTILYTRGLQFLNRAHYYPHVRRLIRSLGSQRSEYTILLLHREGRPLHVGLTAGSCPTPMEHRYSESKILRHVWGEYIYETDSRCVAFSVHLDTIQS
jgi:hypothetical protein